MTKTSVQEGGNKVKVIINVPHGLVGFSWQLKRLIPFGKEMPTWTFAGSSFITTPSN